MSTDARCLFTELLAEYRPDRGNQFPLSSRKVCKRLGVGKSAASRCIKELVERGWLIEVNPGRLRGAHSTRTKTVSIAHFPDPEAGRAASMEFERWSP